MPNDHISAIIDDCLFDYCCIVAKSGKKSFGLETDISWVKTSPTYWPNFIFRANFEDARLNEQIEQVISRMQTGELPDEWIIGPKSNPKNLDEYLNSFGFKKQYSMSGMAIELKKLDENLSIPPNINIEVVDNRDLLLIWTEIVSSGLFNGEIVELSLFEDLFEDHNFKFYLAFYNNQAVASSLLQLSTGVAAIDMVATLHKNRRMGIGTGMTTRPLLDAREMGYTIGVTGK